MGREINAKKAWKRNPIIASAIKPESGRGKAPKVLIVEDNGFNVLPIQKTLTRNHIDYDLAKNGLMAVDRYNQIMKEG